MAALDQRIGDIINGLSPEDKARLVIEDQFRDEPVLSPVARRLMLDAMGVEEGKRYDAVVDKFNQLKDLVSLLGIMATDAKIRLVERDRLLWVRYAYQWLQDTLLLNPRLADLLGDHPRFKRGSPLEIPGLFGAVLRLGVGENGQLTHPFSGEVELGDSMVEGLDQYMTSVRAVVADMKVLLRHIVEEARAAGLDVVEGSALMVVRDVQVHDRPYMEELPQTLGAGESDSASQAGAGGGLPAGAILPVEYRWALVWEEVEENEEVARQIHENPKSLVPALLERVAGDRGTCFLDYVKSFVGGGES
jgi:hypothetical protein